MNILSRITEIVRDQLDEDDIVLTLATEASDIDGWDSLAHVRIVVAIEEAFGIQFQTTEITSLKNVGDLVAIVEARQ